MPGLEILELELDERITELELELVVTATDELERELLVIATDELERELLVAGVEELERLLVVATLDELPQLVRPKGAGWLVQVARETQLLPFS